MRVGDRFCPGVLHAIPAKDGLLVRIRVPGGLLSPPQLKLVADQALACGDGSVEITSRANLQLRGVHPRHVGVLAASLAAAGLLPSPLHDRVRNIVTSPLAGLEGDEQFDPRPLVRALDQQLIADPIFAGLHPKFCFGIYASHRRYCRDAEDISLQAASPELLALSIGGVATGYTVKADDAVACMLITARMCMELAVETELPPRGKTMAAVPGAMQKTLDALSAWLVAADSAPAKASFEEPPWGIHPGAEADRVCITPSVPLGRLTALQAHALADAAVQCEADMRLAPWRGIVLGSIAKAAAQDVVRRLEAVGLDCSGRDGFRGVAACAGSTGCDASLADVRADAVALAARLSGRSLPAGWTVNLSGCEKRCGRRNGAAVELIAAPQGYSLYLAGDLAATQCPPIAAVEAVAAFHSALLTRSPQ
jgi:precorrin-3B synthase